ncbi:MAG: GNAT family N-acetyltransferase [Phaeodactylibacter sp.]|uniref:GNAT family N-acetyltransferase n=1 Tax=Phaeodactylibacter sp. TaxID=1940289 RepID=UPI0032EC6485
MPPKSAYQEFCRDHAVPAFNHPWWLDAICGPDNWGVALAEDKKGELAAALPCHIRRIKGIPFLLTPPLTPYLGLWRYQAYDAFTPADQFTFDRQVIPQLLEQLPGHWGHIQKLHPQTQNWMPFLWQGFQAQLRYHFFIPDLSDLDAVHRQFNRSVKYSIKEGEKVLALEESTDLSALMSIIEHTFDRQGLTAPVTMPLLQRMDEAARAQGEVQLLFARHKEGRLHSGVYLMHTQGVTYPITAGNGNGARDSGAFPWLMWQSIQAAAAHGSQQWNFCGSTMPNVAPLLNGFRAVPVSYFEIYRARYPRATPLLQWLL